MGAEESVPERSGRAGARSLPMSGSAVPARVRRLLAQLAAIDPGATDQALFHAAARRPSALGDTVLPPLTRAADHALLWFGVAGLLALSGRARYRRAGIRGLASVTLSSATVNVIVKPLAPRPRPPRNAVPTQRAVRRMPTSSSFPSGHAASAVAFATGAAGDAPELALLLGPTAAAVAYSRIYTGVHYPGDVLAGAAVGFGAAVLVRRLGSSADRSSTDVARGSARGRP